MRNFANYSIFLNKLFVENFRVYCCTTTNSGSNK